MSRLLAALLLLPILGSCVEGPVELEVSLDTLSSEFQMDAPGIDTYLNEHFVEGACQRVLGFDNECTPSGLCSVSVTCYGISHGYRGYAFSVSLDLICLEGTCTLSTYR